ncbi:MAG TPA: ABC transporter permease [Candidatus Saccharimonadales bacterium]|nr:ABC transporter permease [Candidatus Saccharimonadales bacterium]
MKTALRSEFKKLLSVRSTYILTGISIALVILFAFYIQGFRLTAADYNKPDMLSTAVSGAVTSVAIFGALIAILLMTHEYRYNTIMYTLTNSSSRSKVLLAKVLAISTYALVVTAFLAVLSPVMTYLGVHAAGHTPAHQVLHYGDLAWRSLFYGWGYSMAALLIATLARNQVGAIASLFIVPGAIEQLLGLLLKSNAVYLPFTSLSQVFSEQTIKGGSLSPGKGALVFSLYLVVGWLIGWSLFLRRDAN